MDLRGSFGDVGAVIKVNARGLSFVLLGSRSAKVARRFGLRFGGSSSGSSAIAGTSSLLASPVSLPFCSSPLSPASSSDSAASSSASSGWGKLRLNAALAEGPSRPVICLACDIPGFAENVAAREE